MMKRMNSSIDVSCSTPLHSHEVDLIDLTELGTICLEEFQKDESVEALKCGHIFHEECIER